MAGGDGTSGTGISAVPSPPVVAGGGWGDTVTVVAGVVVAAVVVVVVVVVFPSPESSPPHPVAKEPAAIPAASAKRAEFGITPRIVMSGGIARRSVC
jgi:nitrate/nitrite transporter NarK